MSRDLNGKILRLLLETSIGCKTQQVQCGNGTDRYLVPQNVYLVIIEDRRTTAHDVLVKCVTKFQDDAACRSTNGRR